MSFWGVLILGRKQPGVMNVFFVIPICFDIVNLTLRDRFEVFLR